MEAHIKRGMAAAAATTADPIADPIAPAPIAQLPDESKAPMVANRQTAPPSRATLTVEEAARRLGIGRNQAYDAVHRGEIPVIKIGKRLLVPLAAFERMLNGEAAA